MSALQAEHREVLVYYLIIVFFLIITIYFFYIKKTRNHWLNEKNELETKYFQIQTLLTQTKASFIKKEKGRSDS